MRGTQHKYRARGAEQQDSRSLCSLPSSSFPCVVALQFLTPRPKMLPSLPVKNSVLRQLGIADNELPHELARLKHNLLLPPHTPSQGSNACANSNFSVDVSLYVPGRTWTSPDSKPVWERLKDTVAESSSRPDPEKTFKSLSYLDQIALVCLAAGCRDCRAPDCLQYRSKLGRVVPVCRSWPGLRDWVLCITSCVLRTARDIALWQNRPQNHMDVWSSAIWDPGTEDLLPRCRNHMNVCIFLTSRHNMWDMTERAPEVDNPVGTDESGLIGHQRSTSTQWDVSSRRVSPFYP